jgi:type IV secretory pathway TrbL component
MAAHLQDVIPKISIPPLRAIKKGMKPAVDQSLSIIAYLFSVDVTFLFGIYEAETALARDVNPRI